MNILALDLGTRTGWAAHRNGSVESGMGDFSLGRGEGPGVRFISFETWIGNLLAFVKPDLLAFEDIVRRQGFPGHSAEIYGGLKAVMLMACERRHLTVRPVAVGTWKKAVVGKGNADKEEVMAAMRRLGYRAAEDNEADAQGILEWARRTHSPGPDATSAPMRTATTTRPTGGPGAIPLPFPPPGRRTSS